MGRWRDLFKTITENADAETLTPATPATPVENGSDFEQISVNSNFDTCLTPGNGATAVRQVSKILLTSKALETLKNSEGVVGVPGVSRTENATVGLNGSHVSTIPSSIEVAAPGPALTIFGDFETYNTGGCDLKAAGAWRYASDPATEILCFGYRVGGVDYSWAPANDSRDSLTRSASDPGVAFVCFGGFDPVVWQKLMVERHGFPPIPTRRWIDLRATCSYFALPRSLDKTLSALGLPIEKDKEGQRLVKSLSKPNPKTGAYPEITPAIVQRVAEYNHVDILALEEMYRRGVARLSDAEQAVWELDQRINARGIAIDVGFVEAAKRIVDQQMGELIAEFCGLTGGLSPHQVEKTREWLKGHKWVLNNLDADTVGDTLELPGLPDDVRRVLEIRQIAAATSLKKLDAMLACVGPDGRARGLLQYHGAATGRWSGQLIQPQNFPRPTLEMDVDPEELVVAIKTGDPDALRRWGKPIDVLVSGLRHALTAADGAMFGAGDFAMIEPCVLLALAGQRDKCKLIAEGADIYRDMAATIYGLDRAAFMAIPEDDLSPDQAEQRRIGKNGVLSSGYGIGAEGFYRRFCRHVEGGRELAVRIVGAYRHQWAPKVPALWRDLEQAARQAMLRPGNTTVAQCGISYRLTTQVGLPCLISELPNGKLLHYANARIDGHDKFGRQRWVYNAYRLGQWREVEPYGGSLTENVVSALARELLVDRMFALEAAGYPIILTVHDEIVVEHPEVTKEAIERIMSERPAWAEKLGVPVKAKAWVGKRYCKGHKPPPEEGPQAPQGGPQTADDRTHPYELRGPYEPLEPQGELSSVHDSAEARRRAIDVIVLESEPGSPVAASAEPDERPWALDLYSGAGGATRGLQLAGFRVVGIDAKLQKNYCGDEFTQADALAYLATADLSRFVFIWASPPCQHYTELRHAPGAKGKLNPALIAATRKALIAAGKPYCLENVEDARPHMRNPIMLCGSMFAGLTCVHDGTLYRLERHRIFETNFPLAAPKCAHDRSVPVAGVYGSHVRHRTRVKGKNHTSGSNLPIANAFPLMGVDWRMTSAEISEAIPPAYAKFIAEAWRALARQKGEA